MDQYRKGKVISLHAGATDLPTPTGTAGGDVIDTSSADMNAKQTTPCDIRFTADGAATLTAPVQLWYLLGSEWCFVEVISADDIVLTATTGYASNVRLSPHAERVAVKAAAVSAAVDVDLLQWEAD